MHSAAPGEKLDRDKKAPAIRAIDEAAREETESRDPAQRPVLAFIDPRPLTRESLSHVFRTATRDVVVVPLSNPKDLLDLQSEVISAIELLIVNIASRAIGEQPVHEDLLVLKRKFPDCPIIVLGDRTDGGQVTQALQHGVQGYIPTTLNATVVKEALRLVRAGGTFVPANALVEALEHVEAQSVEPHWDDQTAGEDEGEPETEDLFTPRQLEVLHYLCIGKSNKAIAYELDMQESTVKVHIRQIMKKLKATNRTQAALYAIKLMGSPKTE